jgi:hypothetical protein
MDVDLTSSMSVRGTTSGEVVALPGYGAIAISSS